MLDNEQLAHFHRDGFAHVRGVFTPDEVARLRGLVEAKGREAQETGRLLKPMRGELIPVGDLCSLGELSDLVFDERIVACAKEVLGTDKLSYYGDSSIMVGGSLRGFHKDNAVRYDPHDDDWARPYEMVRFGVYLDDHDRFSGGLKVRVGSHLVPDISTGRIYDVPSKAGDLVFWNMRTTHSGAARRLRGTPWIALHPRVEEQLPDAAFRPSPSPRLAAFLTFARDGRHLERYIAKHNDSVNYAENYLLLSWRHSQWSKAHESRAAKLGITFHKPCADYGVLASKSLPSRDGLVAGQPLGERPPPGRVERAKKRLAEAVTDLRSTL